ncbi:MAG: OmpA family protein [Halocynthiibacter sp.]
MRLLTLGALSVLALSACESIDTAAFMGDEAGAFLDEGGFGNATLHNTQVQNGTKAYVQQLGARFAADVGTNVTFEFNSAVLDNQARAVLNDQARWIKQFPEVRFSVVGHADLVGTKQYNSRIGYKRAQAVVRYLTGTGISRSRVIAVKTRGELEPVIHTQAPERQNRRAITTVSGFFKRHPTVLSGKYSQVMYRKYTQTPDAAPDHYTLEPDAGDK